MNRVIALAAAMFAALPVVAGAQEPKTFFDHIEDSWAVAEIQVTKALHYRDGLVLGFGGQLVDVVHARMGRPRSVFLVHQRMTKDASPPFSDEKTFLAPIVVLPEHSFWRDNLPNTPHHGILGGKRYIFHGDEMAAAKRIAKAYSESLAIKGRARWAPQNAAVIEALHAGVTVLRADAVRRLSRLLPLSKALEGDAVARLAEFLTGDYPELERSRLVAAVGRAGFESMQPTLEKLAARDDAVAASAHAALDEMGRTRPIAKLLDLSKAETLELRAYAYERLGARIAEDERALTAVEKLLASDEPHDVRAAAARGLGRSDSDLAIEPLEIALYRGDGASRDAGSALAAIGGPAAVAILKEAVVGAKGDGMVAAVTALVEVEDGCDGCREYLLGLHRTHEEEAIRDLISIVLELEPEHEH